VAAAAALAALATPAGAHSGALRGATREAVVVPTWLVLATGGAVVGASFLLASFVTDRSLIAAIHGWRRDLSVPAAGVLAALARALGVVLLAAVVVAGLYGPDTGVRNLAVLLVWVVWWGGLVAATYLVGDGWPAVDPFRTLARALPTLDRPYPDRLGAWPAVAGLLALVWIEVTAPLADDGRLLALVVVGYGLATVAGGVWFGPARWFGTADPVSRLLRAYGTVAPVAREDGRLRLRLPGTALADDRRLVAAPGGVAFVVAVLYVTTYDGLVATGPWAGAVEAAVGAGLAPLAVYLGSYLGGFGLFYGAYRLAAAAARRTAGTYLAADALARRFAPALLAIAAGYHLAHNLATTLALAPTVATVAASPLSPPANPPALVVPGWIGGVEVALVLVGHLLAVWVAHAAAYDGFPDRLQAVRSQYGVTAVMVCYTALSLWIVIEPYVPPPYLAT
jgi:hypothetical protein